MKIVLLSTSDISGGAAIASSRMAVALRKQGHEVHQLVLFKKSKEEWVEAITGESWFTERLRDAQYFLTQKFLLKPGYQLSFNPWRGYDVSRHPLVQAADVIQLHWINHGFMGIRELASLFAMQKPIFWHMHDYWAFTGGCHYPGSCRKFESGCGQCPALRNPGKNDATAQQHRLKVALFKTNRPTLVGASAWLAAEANKSSLAQYADVAHIPNPIDQSFYAENAGVDFRREFGIQSHEKVVLFAAMNTADKRKGFEELLSALNYLKAQGHSNIRLFIAGKLTNKEAFPFPVTVLGSLDAVSMRSAYHAADVFVIPSLEENLPNTVLESLSCGTPVAGFATGGIPEMVSDGLNGFLSKELTNSGLAAAIQAALDLSVMPDCLNKCVNSLGAYLPERVAESYFGLFRERVIQK